MAVDDDETERDDAWREKTMNTFKECFGDTVKLEHEWRRYMRELRTSDELIAENM